MSPKAVATPEIEKAVPGSAYSRNSGEPSEAGKLTLLKNVFSVDVEDWFHLLDLPSTPPLSAWNSLPSLVEKNFMRLLDLFAEREVHVTCFFLGWVAGRFPHLVREAASRGHEIASHGYSHQLVYRMTPQEFLKDAADSKKILDDLVGKPVLGYRSSGFSVTKDTPWFFEMLAEAGYRYDSSVFPAPRGHGGLRTDRLAPYRVSETDHALIEFPISVENVLGKRLCFFGGGYLRLFPYAVIRRMARKVMAQGRPVIFYVHPREIDPGHPRLAMGTIRRFKSYVNLRSTEEKIQRIMADFELTTFENLILENPGIFNN